MLLVIYNLCFKSSRLWAYRLKVSLGLAVFLKIKAISLLLLKCGVILSLGGGNISHGYENVMPPPELGEKLTNYRTRIQLQEKAIREAQGENLNPEIRVFKKNVHMTQDEQRADEYVTNKNNDSLNTPQSVHRSSVKTTNVNYNYLGPKQLKLGTNDVYIISLVDGDATLWPIEKVEISNPAFIANITATNMVEIVPQKNAIVNNLATLKIFLVGAKKSEPIRFTLSLANTSKNRATHATVTIPYSSPLNARGVSSGTTNMIISRKSRNSRREMTSLPKDESSIRVIKVAEQTSGLDFNAKNVVQKDSNNSKLSDNSNEAFLSVGASYGTQGIVVTENKGLGFALLKDLGVTVLDQVPKDSDKIRKSQEALVQAVVSLHEEDKDQ